eukprot:CAMPEP_0203676094 /NCGR_PEP_ID=MMETSP0090-20130426/23316_1 /ASSEMBLY_ACC=CAM_ASM_001088 /TAXON_ID=426623 /ORGANISM="Chaetoceros affinis, Strain CCMP159" /LENGTH=557 /DNA_ID=CAMNT_0050542517 /DNA_START=123 /DNA_END=1796 /DNA_ORIENTATION=-
MAHDEKLMEFATNEDFEDTTTGKIDKGADVEEGGDDELKENVVNKSGGTSEDDEELFDTGDEDDDDDDDEDYEDKPWQKKRAKPQSKGSNVSDIANTRQPNDVPKKKKQRVDNNIKEIKEDDSNQKLKKSNAEIRNNSKITNKISDIKKNSTDKKVPSLIANMVLQAPNKDKSYHRITDWKPQEEYAKKQSRNNNKPTSSSSGTPSSNARQKGQSPIPPSQQDRKGNSYKDTPNKLTTKTTTSLSSQQQGAHQKNNNKNNDAFKFGRERNEKITKDLNRLIEKVVESKGKSSSATAIDDLLQPSDFLGQDSMSRSPMRDGASTTDTIDWNGSFIPRTDEERYDFFERDEKGRIKEDSTLKPMFPEDFKRGQKEWPLQWWGIIPTPREIEALHETERPTSRSSSERRNGRGRSRSSDRRGGSGGGERDRGRDRDRDRDRDRGGDRERGVYDQHHPYPHQGGHEGNGPDRHGYGNFHNYPPHFHDRFPPHGRGAGPPVGWQQGHRHDDGWYGRNFAEGGGRGLGGRGGPGPNWGRGGGGGGSGWGGPPHNGGPPRRPMG